MPLPMWCSNGSSQQRKLLSFNMAKFHFSTSTPPTPRQFALPLHCTSQSESRSGRVTRKGLRGVDFLLQRRYLKSISPAGSTSIHVVVGVPLPMYDGKTSDHHLGAALEFCPLIQELNVQSIVVTQYIFDRALFSSLGKRMHQRHSLLHSQNVAGSTLAGHRSCLLDWDVSVGCCNHDCHNALHWALRTQDHFDEHCKSLFLILETLRSSFHYVLEVLPDFLRHHLCVRSDDRDDSDVVRQCWTALGVSAETATQLSIYNLWWDGNTLWATVGP